jgi:hypothetical protein
MQSIMVVECSLETLGLCAGDVLSLVIRRSHPVVMHRGVPLEAGDLMRFVDLGAIRFASPSDPAVTALRSVSSSPPSRQPLYRDRWRDPRSLLARLRG